MLSWLPSFLRQLVLLAALLSFVCSDCNLFVSTGGGQRLSWEGELVSSTNADIYSASTRWCQRVLINISSSGVSSSFGLNSRNPHVFRRVLLAERKRRDGYYCRCRNVYTRNQGTAEREDIFLVVLRYRTGLIDHFDKIIVKTRIYVTSCQKSEFTTFGKSFLQKLLPSGTIHYCIQTCFIKSQVSGSRKNISYCFISKKIKCNRQKKCFCEGPCCHAIFILSANTCVALIVARSPNFLLFWCWCHAALLCSLLLLLHSSPGNSRTEGSDSRCGTQVHAEPKRSQGISLRPSQTEPPTPDSLFTNMFGVSYLLVFLHLLLIVGEVCNNRCNLFTIILSK